MAALPDGLSETFDDPPDDVVAMVGCPNVGKSVLFGALSDSYVHVSNYPGTTVETTTATVNHRALVDTPGVYGISSFDEPERVTRDIVLAADAIINVVSATHLERDLFSHCNSWTWGFRRSSR